MRTALNRAPISKIKGGDKKMDFTKQIFKMLDLEPEEEFGLDGYDGISYSDERYYYDYRLNLYKFDEKSQQWKLCGNNMLTGVLNGSWAIIKHPHTIIKKLKELTREEYVKWYLRGCDKYCTTCPLNKVNCYPYNKSCWVDNKDLYSSRFLEQEIEIEEEK